MALHLSDDEWRCISDFMQTASLSHVCRQTWAALHRRHLTWHANTHNISDIAGVLKGNAAVCTLTLKCTRLRNAGLRALVALRDAPSLTALNVVLQDNDVRDSGAQALAALTTTPSLKALGLDLSYNLIQYARVQALAALKDAPSLTALTLDLTGNPLGDKAMGLNRFTGTVWFVFVCANGVLYLWCVCVCVCVCVCMWVDLSFAFLGWAGQHFAGLSWARWGCATPTVSVLAARQCCTLRSSQLTLGRATAGRLFPATPTERCLVRIMHCFCGLTCARRESLHSAPL